MSITRRKLLALLEDPDYMCALIRRLLTPETASLDHIQPLSKGGSNSIDNLQVLEWTVNRAKGTMTNEEFISMCEDVTNG